MKDETRRMKKDQGKFFGENRLYNLFS